MQSVKSAERSSAATRLQKKLWIWDSNYSLEHFLHQLSLTYYSSKFQFICFYFHNSFQAACHTSGMCLCGFVCVCVHMCACVRECVYTVHYCMHLYKHKQQPLWSERTYSGLCQIYSGVLIQADAKHLDVVIKPSYVSTPSLISSQIHISWNHLSCLNSESLALLLSGIIQADFGHMDRILLFFL